MQFWPQSHVEFLWCPIQNESYLSSSEGKELFYAIKCLWSKLNQTKLSELSNESTVLLIALPMLKIVIQYYNPSYNFDDNKLYLKNILRILNRLLMVAAVTNVARLFGKNGLNKRWDLKETYNCVFLSLESKPLQFNFTDPSACYNWQRN